MDQFVDWAEIPNASYSKNEDLDQYLQEYDNGIDDLFNQTLLGIQDLDVPTGFVNDMQQQQTNMQLQHQQPVSHTASNSFNFHHAKHSRKISGTAIFGFDNHTRELSIDKSVSPGQLMKLQKQNQQPSLPLKRPLPQKPITIQEQEMPNKIHKKGDDFLVSANNTPKSYKFPPSPSPSADNNDNDNNSQTLKPGMRYSAKYLQELSRYESNSKPPNYVDDIEPLLKQDDEPPLMGQSSTPFVNPQVKYVPIPVQEPDLQRTSPQQQINNHLHQQQPEQNFNSMPNAFLPPPSPPTLSHGSPEQSSPEPHPFTRDSSPTQLNSSPIRHQPQQQQSLFYNPQYNTQYFSDGPNYLDQNYSSPINPLSVSSSPVKNSNYFSSPLRHIPMQNNDDTIDANDTIPQMTPLKASHPPMTPSKNKVLLEWSPIVSPNAENNKNVAKAIRQSSPKKRIKKTSLLPPGELDKYWEGPDDGGFFICHYKNCGKKFTRRYNVRSHIQTHLSDRPFACAYCPKNFVRQHDLNRHIKGHLESRHWKCPCGKEFTRIDALKKHRLRNTCSSGISPEEAETMKYSSPTKFDQSSPSKYDYSSPEKLDNHTPPLSHEQSQIPEEMISQSLLQNIDEISPFK